MEKGVPRIEWAVLDWNKSAIDFYNTVRVKVCISINIDIETGRIHESVSRWMVDISNYDRRNKSIGRRDCLMFELLHTTCHSSDTLIHRMVV